MNPLNPNAPQATFMAFLPAIEAIAARVRVEVCGAGIALHGASSAPLRALLGCAPRRAFQLWNGHRPFMVDELETIARAVDLPVPTLLEKWQP